MTANDRTLELKLIARDMLSDVIKGVEKSVGGLGDTIKSAGMKAAGAWPTVAQGIKNIHDGFGKLQDTAGMALGALESGWNALVAPAMESQRIMDQTENVIRSTGGAAGMTADEIDALADRMERLSGADANLVQSGENMLLTFTNIGQEVFPNATQTMLDMAVAMNNGSTAGIDLKSTAIQLGKALNDPVKGVSALAEVGVTFTDSQKAQIKAMMDVNDVAGAQTVILQELQREFGGAAEAAGKSAEGKFNKVARALEGIGEAIGNFILPVVEKAADYINLMTDGTTDLASAFHASQQAIYADLLAGNMSLEDYNAAIVGMTNSIRVWDEATGTALRNQTMMSQTQLFMVQTMQQAQSAIQRTSAVATADAAAADRARAQSLNELAVAALQGKDALSQELEAEQAQVKAFEASITAQAAYRDSLGEVINKHAAAAQSFKDVADAQASQMLAQGQLDTLKQAYDKGSLSAESYYRAVDAVLLRNDLATPKSIAMAEAQRQVDEAFLEGDLPLKNYIVSAEKIPGIAADGKVTLEELVSLGIKPTTKAARDQDGVVKTLKDSWDKIPENVKTTYTIEQRGDVPAAASGATSGGTHGRGGQGMALGGLASAGQPRWIGEHGAEPFFPAVDGRVLSRRDAMDALSRGGGRSGPQINISIAATLSNQMDVDEMAWRLSEVIGDRLKSYQ